MWTQIVGKLKLELAPFLNEWWQVAFALTSRGMTTGLIPWKDRAFGVDFDFIEHKLHIQATDGADAVLPLVPKSVADFYGDFLGCLETMGIEATINPVPAEVPNPVPFDANHVNASYDSDAVNRWWRIQIETEKVLQRYRATFVGKSSPIHFFWGSFDLAHSRFSGRPAPIAEGMPRFFQRAEDQENVSCGFWPGHANSAGVALGEPAFYSYVYPAQPGYNEASVRTSAAHFDERFGEYILTYEDLRRDTDPADSLLEFFQSTYDVAADLGNWDRARLEE